MPYGPAHDGTEAPKEATIPERPIRIGAIGDLHAGERPRRELVERFTRIGRDADILVLCGDLTDHGEPAEMRALVEELAGVEIPIVAVLGNHDHQAGEEDELAVILEDRGVRLLDGDNVVIEGVGFAGVKGFCGGFGRYTITPFGELRLKEFVHEAIDETLKLENALRTLATPEKVVVMHFAPIEETVAGEPEPLYPFLGTSRFVPPIETLGASVVFHGHAHYGSPEGRTPAGIPVYNVARHLLERRDRDAYVWTGVAPERRGERPDAQHRLELHAADGGERGREPGGGPTPQRPDARTNGHHGDGHA